MEKDFITVTPDSGTGNATVTVVASENSGQDERSTSISISGGTMKRTLSINQEATPIPFKIFLEIGRAITHQYGIDFSWSWSSSLLENNGQVCGREIFSEEILVTDSIVSSSGNNKFENTEVFITFESNYNTDFSKPQLEALLETDFTVDITTYSIQIIRNFRRFIIKSTQSVASFFDIKNHYEAFIWDLVSAIQESDRLGHPISLFTLTLLIPEILQDTDLQNRMQETASQVSGRLIVNFE